MTVLKAFLSLNYGFEKLKSIPSNQMNVQYNRTFEIIYAKDGSVLCADEIKEKVNRVIRVITKEEIRQSDVVYINIDRGFDVVIAIIACLQLELAFTSCESNAYMYKTHSNHRKFRTTLVFNGKEVTRIAENENECHEICYVINTSGTSGNTKKQVAVPLGCIKANIEHFCTIFDVTPSDTILFSTSLLFDPSIVELFMAFHVGCRLLITPDIFRSEPHRMQKAIEQFKPTIAQFTPTVFEMLPSPDCLLSSTSSLRILLIGGSHFPLDYINSIRCSGNTTRIFNVYGVTEVSCWASYFEIEIGCEEVLIGKEVMGTTLEVDANNQLILGGPRQCYVNGNKAERHETGDLVGKTKNGELRLVGRMDRMVKHRGVRVCLDQLTELILKQQPTSTQLAYSIHYKNRDIVIFVTGPSTSNDVSSILVPLDNTTFVMVRTIHVESLPINSSGKVDEYELRRICEERFCSVSRRNMVKKLLKEKLGVDLDEVLDQSFVEIGVNSLMAAEISLYFGDDQENVTREILNNTTTIRKVLETFGTSEDPSCFIEEKTDQQVIRVSKKRQPKMKWSVDLGKCIDGNILVIRNDLVVCASHSGVIVAMDPKIGRCLWRTECKVRFECAPILANRRIVIGSKSHGLFFLCLETGKILNVIDLAVRSTCASNENFIFCSTNDGYFHSIDPESFSPIFHHKIEPNGGGTSIGPIIAPDGSVFATTTSGLFSRITNHSNLHVSLQKKMGPIFSEPLFLEDNTVLVTSVNGVLTIISSDTGEEKDSKSLKNENCFCAPLKIGPNKILVATQSGKIIDLDIKPKLRISIIYRFDLPGISFI
ncbi:hypothetical protein B9Z55_009743 [Caenorhabditis nigoni]|uniref:AMP-dependent synthetase/ligase domain-containing protein n=1 Tax=Caenorhabditis nigoni TaxID=1611254 RepID=A0A2G5UTE9_9PELO|nr:hypothetical protein B9Z55_009743 [Caenorhabditis nigoni]